jgi:predicted  nucleic acid-binding Zn-ribbon protein
MRLNWSDLRFFVPPDDIFQYGYTVKPQQEDGKFHFVVTKKGVKIKDLAFGRRKIAKSLAYRWYEKRMQTLRSREDAAIARRELRERAKPKLTPTEKKINMLKARIDNAQKRQRELLKIIKQSQSRVTRATNAATKWFRKEQTWIKQLQELQNSTDQRVTAFVREFDIGGRDDAYSRHP